MRSGAISRARGEARLRALTGQASAGRQRERPQATITCRGRGTRKMQYRSVAGLLGVVFVGILGLTACDTVPEASGVCGTWTLAVDDEVGRVREPRSIQVKRVRLEHFLRDAVAPRDCLNALELEFRVVLHELPDEPAITCGPDGARACAQVDGPHASYSVPGEWLESAVPPGVLVLYPFLIAGDGRQTIAGYLDQRSGRAVCAFFDDSDWSERAGTCLAWIAGAQSQDRGRVNAD